MASLEIDEADERQLAAAANSDSLGRKIAAIARLKQQSLFRDRNLAHVHNGEFLKQRLFRSAATMRMSSALRH